MQPRTAVIIGATGMVGEQVVNGLLIDPSFNKVRLLVRRPIHLVHDKLEVEVTDFNDMIDFKNKMGTGDALFCCVGTTSKKVKGDNDAYKKVDYDIPLHAAQFAAEAGFSQYLLASSAGANAASKNFYLRLKGEVETAIDKQKFSSIHIFRPGFLLGDRKEFRPGEYFGKYLMKAISVFMRGKLSRFKATHANAVANAMIAATHSPKLGTYIYHNDEINSIATRK